MTMQPVGDVAPRQTSKSSVASLIFGVLGCLPIVTGILAVILGFVGIRHTGPGRKSGRWMAVTGLVLGVVSVFAWVGAGVMGGGVYAIIRATEGPRVAAHDFLRDASAGNDAAAQAEMAGMASGDYDALATAIREQGKFEDSTFTSTNIMNDEGKVDGSATFEKGGASHTVHVSADLLKVGGKWKVKRMTVTP